LFGGRGGGERKEPVNTEGLRMGFHLSYPNSGGKRLHFQFPRKKIQPLLRNRKQRNYCITADLLPKRISLLPLLQGASLDDGNKNPRGCYANEKPQNPHIWEKGRPLLQNYPEVKKEKGGQENYKNKTKSSCTCNLSVGRENCTRAEIQDTDNTTEKRVDPTNLKKKSRS